MPISFRCNGCGKDYAVSDGLAGKRAACKSCGHKMTIPGVTAAPIVVARPASPPTARAERAVPVARQVERPTSRPRRDPIPEAIPVAYPVAKIKRSRPIEPEPPAEDIYGLDEAPSPLPPLMPRGGDPGGGVAVEAPVKKKKKKKGFFSSGGSKKSSAGSYRGSDFGLGGVRLMGGLVAIVIGVGGYIWSRSTVDSLHERDIALTHRFVNELKLVNDLSSAHATSPRLNATLQLEIELLESVREQSFDKRMLDDLEAQYRQRHQAAENEVAVQIARIARIPGAIQALNIQAKIDRLAELNREADAKNARAGFR